MKGIVADINQKYIVVLSSDGRFIKMRNNGLYSIGSEVDLEKPSHVNMRLAARTASIAAGFILVLGLGYGAYCYTVPYSYVDVDINPSVEITTNVFDRILKVEGLNDDGQKLLQVESLKNSTLDEGIAFVLNNAVKQGYLNEETTENAIVMTVVSGDDKKSEKLQKTVEAAVNTELENEGISSDFVVSKASHEERESAKKKGLTPGKLNLIEKAVDAEPKLKAEDLKDAPVKDILKQIKENRKNSGKEDELDKTVGKKENDTDEKNVKKNNGKNTGDDKDTSAKNSTPADKNGGNGKGTAPDKGSNSNKGSNSDKNEGSGKNAGSGENKDSNKGTNSGKGSGSNKNTGSDKGADRNKNGGADRKWPDVGNNDTGGKGNNTGGKDNGKSDSQKGFNGFNFLR